MTGAPTWYRWSIPFSKIPREVLILVTEQGGPWKRSKPSYPRGHRRKLFVR